MSEWPEEIDYSTDLSDLTQRQLQIIREIQESGLARIDELARLLGVSEMSIRRDAAVLENAGLARRVPGALVPPSEAVGGSDFPRRSREQTEAKEEIARKGAELVAPGDVLAIDAGSTCFGLAHLLGPEFEGTIISHSLPVLNALAARESITTIGLGGEQFHRSRAFVGSLAVETARQLRATTFFMGAAAVGVDGIYASWDAEKDVKLALASISQKVVVLVDHTKFSTVAPVFLTQWRAGMSVVTDQIPAEIAKKLETQGVEVIVV